jgi:hypothetical protein
VGIITRPIVRLARSSSFYDFVQMDGHRRWVLANERSHLIAVARDLPVAAERKSLEFYGSTTSRCALANRLFRAARHIAPVAHDSSSQHKL